VVIATIKVFLKPSMMFGLLTNTEYHFVLKPVHINGASDLLNDIKMSTEIGRYKNTRTP
jgi:hypothetical protein